MITTANKDGIYELSEELKEAMNVSVDMVDNITAQSIDCVRHTDCEPLGKNAAPAVAAAHIQASATVYAGHVVAAAIDGLAEQVRLLRSARPA